MNYSFMSFSAPELTLKESLDTAYRFGYDGFEPRLVSNHGHKIETTAPADYLVEAKKIADDAGIAFACIATSCMFSDPGTADAHVDEAKRVIDLAEKLGSRAIRVFGGKIPDGLTREKSMDSIIGSLSKLAAYAKNSGVYVCIETHDDWHDPSYVAEIAKASGCSVNWDIMHTDHTAKYPPKRVFELLKSYIRHIHVHDGAYIDGSLKFRPVGEGDVDHATPLKLLKQSGYEGFISGEWIGWEPWEVHLPREIAALKNLEG